MKKDNVIFLLMLISGLIIGSYLGSIAVIVPWLEWLNYGKTIGLTQPFVLDLGFENDVMVLKQVIPCRL